MSSEATLNLDGQMNHTMTRTGRELADLAREIMFESFDGVSKCGE
jgi:hypothetical protein